MNLDLRKVPQNRLRLFGSVRGRDVHEAVLRSPGGIEARVLTYGAIIRDLTIRMPDGSRQSMVLGHETLESYITDPNYFGALVGRFANRIADGRFTLNGATHILDRNENDATLHGGSKGFSTQVWTIDQLTETTVTLRLVSPDGEQGFPGELTAVCRYEVSDQRGFVVQVSATTTRPTPVSLAQHSYFTLGTTDVRDLLLTVHADRYTPVNDARIPTGEIVTVDGTPFDFRSGQPVGDVAGGLDHNFVLRSSDRVGECRSVARLENRQTGLVLEVETTQPGLQVYDGSMIRSATHGTKMAAYAGLCLETQAFPDSPNQPGFPDAILRSGQAYDHTTLYRFQPSSDPKRR
jgi:aldose 1-epimerase